MTLPISVPAPARTRHLVLPPLLAVLCLNITLPAAAESLTLPQAVQHTLQQHPHLQAAQWRLQAAHEQRAGAALSPAYELTLEAENLAGSGAYRRLDQAEFTLSLSSVIEPGAQRSARMNRAGSAYEQAQAARDVAALDVLTQVTQQFISTLALQEKRRILAEAAGLAGRNEALIARLVQRGAAPASEQLRAVAARHQAQLQLEAAESAWQSQRFTLTSFWHQSNAPESNDLDGDLFAFRPAADFAALEQQLLQSPASRLLSSESRLREATLALARSRAATSLQWSLGVRQLQDSGDTALLAGVSLPLFSSRRNQPDVLAAQASYQAGQQEQQNALLNARNQLFSAWQAQQQGQAAALRLRDDIIPALAQALQQARNAYERGAYRYSDWMMVQREWLEARLAAIDAASAALLSQTLTEQLTAAGAFPADTLIRPQPN